MATKNKKKQDLAEQIINGTYKPSTKSTFSGARGSQSRTIKNNLDKEVKEERDNYFDDGYQFGDVTKTGIHLAKNVFKTPENFKDGYQFGDISKTVGSTALDIGAGTIKGMMNLGESAIADPLQYGVAQVSDWMGFDNFANAVRENAKQNGVEQTFAPIDKLTDRYTAIGTTGDQLSSGIGNVIAMGNMSGLLKAKGLPSSVNVGKFAIPTTSIASGIGSGMTEAYNNGASDGEAWTYGALSGLAEGFSESLFGGLGKKFNLNVGEGGLDDFLVKKFTDKISNNTIRILAESGLKATGEGVEEILSGIGSAVSKKLTYLSEKDLEALIKDENLAEQFIMGTLTSLISQTPGTIQSVKTGTDLITGQPTNNQALTPENMQENVPYTVKNNKGNAIAPLGNNALNTPVLNKNNQSYNVLNNGKEYAPYVPINNTFRYKKSTNPKINALNESMVKSNFDNSIESKSLSEVASVIVEDKGWNVLFDNTITNKNGEPVNALVTTENGEITIRVNPNSTRAAEFLIMHEVTHGIETSELLNLANDYASKNPEFAKVMESLKTKYSEKDINSEVLADISGQLFGNQEFINSLVQDGSIQNKNIITKIYDAIKRLLNSLTEKGRQKNAYYDFVSELEQKWRKAYKEATTESAISNLKDNVKYSVIYNEDGSFNRIKINDNIFENNEGKSIDRTIYDYIKSHIGEMFTIIESGQKVYIGKDLPNEYIRSKSAQNLTTASKLAKGRASSNFKEIIENVSNRKWEKSEKTKHKKDAKYGFYKYDTVFSFNHNGKEKIYRGTVLIRNDENGKKYLYDILNIRPQKKLTNLPSVASNSNKSSARIDGSSSQSASNIPQSNKTVKSSTSVKHSIEENNNKTWREHLEENYEATGTRTYMPEHITNANQTKRVDNINPTDSNDIRYSVEENGTEFEKNNLKQQQLDIILNNNPAEDDYHTWIRNVDDIKTFEESLQDDDWIGWETDGFDPDYDASMVKQALKTGKITVYSSYPIEQGIFVTPSKMEAESYSGNGKIYSKEVNLKDVAWIDPTQGQYAKTDISNTKFSIEETTNDQIQGLEDYTKPQIKNITTDYIKTALEYADVQADIVGMEIVGSRNRGTARLDSDLDIVVELTGEDLREDDLFNILNDDDEPLEINGIKVDINPILVERSGSLEEFMKRSNAYDKEQTKNSKSKYPDWINKIVPNEPYRKYRNYINDLMIQKQDETGLRITSDSSGVLVWQHGYASSLEKIKFEDTKKLAQQIYDLKATDNKGRTLSNEVIQKTKNSKARDEKGNLLSLYHGSPNIDITEFDINKSGQNTMSAEYGIYFTDSEKIADDFSYERIETDSMFFDKKGKKGKVYEAYLNLEKPLDFRKLSKQEISDLYEYASHLGQLDGKETFVEDMTKWQQIGNHQLMKVNLNLKKLSNKYDGFIAKMDVKNNELEYVVFDPKQVLFVDKNNESIKTNNIDNKGYHWGDLGKGRDTYHWNMSSSRRSTGHFGTGTYFLGSKDGNIGSTKNGRPLHEVDFSKYNLFKPENENEAYTLHKGLKALNYINNFNSDDFESLQLMLEKHGITGQKSYEAFVKARELYFSDEYQNASYDSKLDSISTYFMKELGFNGIDVRGIERYDNGSYGSVIYDLDNTVEENDSLINAPKQDNKGRKLTKEQQEHFKDSAIRVKPGKYGMPEISKDGQLFEVYHGTNSDTFTVFDENYIGSSNDTGWYGKGFYFAFTEGEAKTYGCNVIKAYLNIKKPFNFSKEMQSYDGIDSGDVNFDFGAFAINLNEKFPDIARKETVRHWERISIDEFEAKEIPFKEVAEKIKEVYDSSSLKIIEIDDNGKTKYQYVYHLDLNDFNVPKDIQKIIEESRLMNLRDAEFALENTKYYKISEEDIKKVYDYYRQNDVDFSRTYIGYPVESKELMEKSRLSEATWYVMNEVYKNMDMHMPEYYMQNIGNDFREELVKNGYDGVIQSSSGDEIVAFYPNQIKRVDNLNPSDSDDIRYSMIEDPIEISKLKKEDASTTPIAPFVKTEGGKEDGRSKHYSNLTKKSKFLNDKSVAAISNENGVKYYDKTTNKETLEKAKKELNNGGKSETLKWFNKDPKNADPTDIAKGWILLKQYQDKGDYDSVVQVAKKMRMMGTTTGKTLQMYAIMERLTPEGMVNYAQSELSEAYELMIKNKSKAWIDKHKSDFDLSPSEVKFIMDTMQEVSKMQDGYEKDVKLAEIQKLMTDKLPPEKGAGIKAWMRISMLFNPKTQVRNVLGNAVIAPVNAVGDAFASGIDKMIAKKTGVRTTGNVNLSSYNEGFKKGLYKSYNDFKKGINTRNIEGNRFEIGQGKSFNDKTLIGHKLNQIDNLLSFMLDAGDRGFYEATFNNSINNQLILNNTTKVTPEMIDIATTEALQRTWQDNNEYTKFVLNTRKGLNKLLTVGNYGLGDILIPFAKTPANLTKAIIDYSPVGLVKAIIEGNNLKNAIETGQFTPQQQHKFVQDLGKAVAGTMLYILGYALAKADITSGENDEDKDTANFMKNTLGISPYSIKIGNKSFTYDWAQPIAAPFAIMADLEAKENEDATLIEKAIDSFNTGFNIVIEQSFMQSIKTVLDNNDGIASGIQEAIMELPSRAIPTLSKQIADMVDGTQRQTFVYGKPVETAVNKVISKIPGASKALAPTVDTLGREIKKYGGKNNIYNVFINPASVSTENVSESAEEIYRLYKETGRTDLMPRVSPYYVNYNGEKIVLSNEDKSRFQKVSGDIIEKNVQKIINSSTYKSLTDEQKADVIQDIVNYSYNKARFEILGIEMSDTYQSVSDYEDAGGNISDYYLFQSNIDNTNSETKKQSISNYLINSNLSDKEISYLYNKYYSSDEKMNLLSKFNIPVKEYIKFNLKSFESDYNNNGKAISGSKQAKVFNYINSLKLSATQKAILMKMQYKSYKKYDNQILKYINSLNATKFEKASYAKKLGFDYYDDYLINQILKKGDLSNEEKIKQLKALGFKYINGKIYK